MYDYTLFKIQSMIYLVSLTINPCNLLIVIDVMPAVARRGRKEKHCV